MKTAQRIASLFICVFLSSCALLLTRSPDWHATNFIDTATTNCGKVHPGETSTDVENCIFESLESHTPFFTWYWLRPVDSVPASGLMLNENGELFVAWYDSGYLFWGSLFNATKCSSWKVREIKGNRKLVCKIPQSEKAYLFEMDTFAVIENEKR